MRESGAPADASGVPEPPGAPEPSGVAGSGDAGARPTDAVPSPLDLLPGLAALATRLSDAVMVTDSERRVLLWNGSAERLYGIRADEAIGSRIETLYTSTYAGQGTSSIGARDLALEHGSWHGRVVDVPRIGVRAGQEVIIDAVLDRLEGPDGAAVGVISVKRDVTASARLERELSTLGSLATATGQTRSRATLAQRALDAVAATTGADHGAIVMPHGGVGKMVAVRNVPPVLEHIAGDAPWADSPAIRALTPVGRVVRGSVDRLPLDPVTRRELMAAGIRSLLLVGLHRDDELIGLLSLAWDRDVPIPSDAVAQLAATTIGRALENARLVEDIVRRTEAERDSSARLRKVDELARAGASARSLHELADRSARLVNDALGAAGTVYAILAPDGVAFDAFRLVAVHPPVERWLRAHPPDLGASFVRWRAGEGAHLGALEAGVVAAPDLELAREAGVSAYAALPIRLGDEVVGGVAAYFERPLAALHLDRRDLDRLASIASMALENFRLREQVAAGDQRYRALFEGSSSAMVLALPDGTLVDANAAALRVFGSEREWLIGRRPEEVAVFDFEQIASRLANLNVGESFSGYATGIRRDGRRFPIEVETTSILIEGEPRFLGRFRDLTDEERMASQLAAAQKMDVVGRVAPGIAHELGNPLAAILGFSQLIRRDPSLPGDLRQDAELLVAEAERTRQIAGSLLDLIANRPPERHPTQLRALVDSVLTLQSSTLAPGTIDVSVDIPDDLPPVELDRGQLQQVLLNLTRNAAESVRGAGGRRIGINAVREGRVGRDERVRITVMDDGGGVAPEHVDRLFEPFFTTKAPGDGTGLGLSVSRSIVRAHGGDLRYAPSPWGQGAAFTFDLPVRAVPPEGTAAADPASAVAPAAAQARAAAAGAEAAPETSAETTREGRAAGAGRVLVLDDDPTLRIYLEKALTALGYDPVVAAQGSEAVGLAATGDLAAILCDHQMLGMSGVEVYEAVVADRPDLARRFVMMSGDVLDPALEAFAATHELTRLAKPFDLDTLERTLRAVTGGGRQSRG